MNGAGVILFYGNLVLLCKRALVWKGSPVAFGGYWSPFTGAIEDGESPLVCAARELEEESGLKLHPYELKYITQVKRKSGALTLYAHELSDLFLPKLDLEHTEFGYFKIDDINSFPTPLDKPIRRAIERYEMILRSSPNKEEASTS